MSKSSEPQDEPAARALLAAGKPLPLAWLWLLGDARIVVTNAGKPGRVMQVEITDDAPRQTN